MSRIDEWQRTISPKAGSRILFLMIALLPVLPSALEAQRGGPGLDPTDTTGAGGAPLLTPIIEATKSESDLRVLLLRYEQDLAGLGRRYDIPFSEVRRERLRTFHRGWTDRIAELDPAALNAPGREDLDRLRVRIDHELTLLDQEERYAEVLAPLSDFASTIQDLQKERRDRLDIEDPIETAARLHELRVAIRDRLVQLESAETADPLFAGIDREMAARGDSLLGALDGTLDGWFEFYDGFDPLFTWWVTTPYEEVVEALHAFRVAIRERWQLPDPDEERRITS